MVGLLVSLGAFAGHAEQRGEGVATSLLARYEALTKEIGGRHGMTPVKTADGELLLLGDTEETAIGTANALVLEFQPTERHIPAHIVGVAGDVVRLENGETIELAERLSLTAHPGQPQPATRT